MIAAADIRHGAHAVERLARQLPVSARNVEDIHAALRLAYIAQELLTERDELQRRVDQLERSAAREPTRQPHRRGG